MAKEKRDISGTCFVTSDSQQKSSRITTVSRLRRTYTANLPVSFTQQDTTGRVGCQSSERVVKGAISFKKRLIILQLHCALLISVVKFLGVMQLQAL
jgi:hypothetical protein